MGRDAYYQTPALTQEALHAKALGDGCAPGRLPQRLIPQIRDETPMPTLLAALLACLMLTTVIAQEAPTETDGRTAVLFEIGMTALHDKAINGAAVGFHPGHQHPGAGLRAQPCRAALRAAVRPDERSRGIIRIACTASMW